MAAQKKWIALLRGIGASTHKKMSMQDLREACSLNGLNDVSTYIASGNLLFSSSRPKRDISALLDDIIASFDLQNAAILRQPAELKKTITNNPYEDAASQRPNHLLLAFYNSKVDLAISEKLSSWPGAERLCSLERELYVDYHDGVGRSKLTQALIDKQLNQVGTARNWNTVRKLIELSA